MVGCQCITFLLEGDGMKRGDLITYTYNGKSYLGTVISYQELLGEGEVPGWNQAIASIQILFDREDSWIGILSGINSWRLRQEDLPHFNVIS